MGLYRDNDINAFYTVFIYKYYKMYSFSSLINTIEAQYSLYSVKTWKEFDLTIFKVIKVIHYKRIEVFTIRFNLKSIATSCSNLLI